MMVRVERVVELVGCGAGVLGVGLVFFWWEESKL